MLYFQRHVQVHLVFLVKRQHDPQHSGDYQEHPERQDVLATLRVGRTAHKSQSPANVEFHAA